MLSFPRGTEMFQFPRFPPPALCVQAGVTGHDPSRVSPFGYPRIKAWSTAPRGFSQPPTSFIGIWRQGIHRWLFIAWEFFLHCFFQDARARSAVLKGRARSCAAEPHPQRAARMLELDAGRPTDGPRPSWTTPHGPGMTRTPRLRAGRPERGCVAAPSQRNSDARRDSASGGAVDFLVPGLSLRGEVDGVGRAPRSPNNQ